MEDETERDYHPHELVWEAEEPEEEEADKLLSEAIAFIAVASTSHANPNPGGRLNAADLIMRIQKHLGFMPRDVLPPDERQRLKEEMNQ